LLRLRPAILLERPGGAAITTSNGKAGFFDNLVPLRGDTFGPQLAGWSPGAPVATGLGCRIHAKDAMVPVDEHTSVAVDVYTPKQPGRYPAILAFAAYSKELAPSGAPTGTNETGSPPVLTDRGYVHVIAARRGMGRSQGSSTVWFSDQDVEDHAKIIEWAAAQPWCDGNVVTFGTSYYGITQPQVAAKKPPALKAFFAIEMCTDFFRHIVMFGGAPQAYFLSLWTGGNFTESQEKLRVPPIANALLSHVFNSRLKRYWWPQLQKRLAKIQGGFMAKTPTRAYRELFANLVFDGKTRETNWMPAGPYAEMGRITAPFVVVQNPGHLNLHQFGAYDLFENAATPPGQKWLIIGAAEYDLPCMHWQLEALAFFDHVLFGAANGYAEQPSVRYLTDGTGEYHAATDFPIPGRETIRLHPTGAANGEPGSLSPDAAHSSATSSWAAMPIGAPFASDLDGVTDQVLCFETDFAEETEFAGPVTANLNFSCNEIDSYVIARVGRVEESGVYHLLSLGAISPARRRIDETRSTSTEVATDVSAPEPLVPGEPVTLRFSLTPQPVVFSKGERLRLEIGSRTDLLFSDASHGHAQFNMQVPPYFSRNTLHLGADTYIELDRLPAKSRSPSPLDLSITARPRRR
jgi:putative CocE/NonD family hydrolase